MDPSHDEVITSPVSDDKTEEMGPVWPWRVYSSFGFSEVGSKEGIWKMWVCRSTPPAAKRMFVSTVFGDTQVAHVAPRVVGSGKVHNGSCVVDIGKTCRWDRYDDRRMYLVVSVPCLIRTSHRATLGSS